MDLSTNYLGIRLPHPIVPGASPLADGRAAWIQILRGNVGLGGHELTAGDGAGITSETELIVVAAKDTEMLLFDLP